MLNFNLTYLLTTVLLSCNTVKNSVEIKNNFTVISAERSKWFGGREGVKGEAYNIVLKNNQKQAFHFTKFYCGKDSVPFTVKSSGDNVFISANINLNSPLPNVDLKTGKEVLGEMPNKNNSEIILQYTLGNSKTVNSLPVKNFVEVNNMQKNDDLIN